MDLAGYKSFWTESTGDIPKKRINVASHVWDLSQGEGFFRNFRFKDIICKKIKKVEDLPENILESNFVVSPAGDISGHMMVKDCTISRFCGCDSHVPIMPNYVRDLAGRIICIAECFPIQKESYYTGRFPTNSFVIDENYEGFDLLENIFFSSFRTLDPVLKSENSEFMEYVYPKSNLHPYKLRVDTFYQDGWRIPQTELLYVKINEDKQELETALNEFLSKWELAHSHKKGYEEFYEEVGGEEYFEELFQKGVTLIPTLEGYNATCIVDKNFNLVDFNQGKIVPNFHEIIGYKDSNQPAGTIIEVIEPGYITEFNVKKAKVFVSNGNSYVSENKMDPDPVFPNLKLPHQRTSEKWGNVYIPTHPKHFEKPAIWGWDPKTGAFIQEKGPIWDPLHYYYKSVDKIIDSFQDEPFADNLWFYEVPNEMKLKFYPVVPFAGFDIFDIDEKIDRSKYISRPFTVCKRVELDVFCAEIGYHPMPVEYEYEFDPWFSPELSPVNRVYTEVPLNIRDRLIGVIKPSISVKEYQEIQNKNSKGNPTILTEDLLLRNSQGDLKKDFPYLDRYTENIVSEKLVSRLMIPLFYSEIIDIEQDRAEYISELDISAQLDEIIPDMNLAYYEFKDISFVMLQNRYRLYNKHKENYIMSYWNSLKAEEMEVLDMNDSSENLDQGQFSSVAIMQPPEF